MMIQLEQLGARLSEGRRSSSLSQREVARRVGVSASLISQIETGKVQPSVATLMAIANELGLSIDEMLHIADTAVTPQEPDSFDTDQPPLTDPIAQEPNVEPGNGTARPAETPSSSHRASGPALS